MTDVKPEFKPFLSPMRDAVRFADIAEGAGMVGTVGDVHTVLLKQDGKLRALTAICTHLRCIVQFKGDRKSIDCPCHGSRYNLDGTVLNGPAKEALESFAVEVRDGAIWVAR
ncbi:MAG: Rieske 2Fe-2S domain-containing protein [Candidatus Andersenbacteria bacterium]